MAYVVERHVGASIQKLMSEMRCQRRVDVHKIQTTAYSGVIMLHFYTDSVTDIFVDVFRETEKDHTWNFEKNKNKHKKKQKKNKQKNKQLN